MMLGVFMNLFKERSRIILPFDWVMIKCLFAFLSLMVIFLIVNTLTFKYAFVNAFRSYQVVLFAGNLIAYAIAVSSGVHNGYLVTVIKGIGLIGTIIGFHLLMVGIIITTPFPLQDQNFYNMDLALGYDHKMLIQYMIDHTYIRIILSYLYDSLKTVVLSVGIGLLLSLSITLYYRYAAYFLISFLIGALIYYFFPSTDVASIVPSPIFSPSAYVAIHQFDLEHNYRVITQFAIALISMPSFHTIWAMAISFVFWKQKIMRYVAIFYTTMVIISALLLGAHFLVDIIAGLIISIIVWWFVTWIFPNRMNNFSVNDPI